MRRASSVRHTIRLRSGVSVEAAGERADVRHPWGAIRVSAPAEVIAVLVALSGGELDFAGLAERKAGAMILNGLPYLLSHGVYSGAEALLTVEPISDRSPALAAGSVAAASLLSLDRFAYLRRRPEMPGLALESPLALHRAQLGSSIVPWIARIAAAPLSLEEISGKGDTTALQLLIAAGLIRVTQGGEEEEERLATWSFHDLVFHARSRPGRTDEWFGAHFRHRDRIAAPPAVPPAGDGPAVDLRVPRFADVVAAERSLTEVLESRSSVRDYGEEPVHIDQFGEFLYRSARTRGIAAIPAPSPYDGADHPYPTGGLAGDLEVYACVSDCTGLAPGVYHYESAAHRLRLVNAREAAEPLLASARVAAAGRIEPQILLTITSRFARTSWKYEAIAYALTLKHVGMLMQTMYLVATSMGLGLCALGSGDADRAARAFGLDWLVESSVGELALGSRREPGKWVDAFTDLVGKR